MLSRMAGHRKSVLVALTGAATLAISGPLAPAQGADSGAEPQAGKAQSGCVLKSLSLRKIAYNHDPPEASPGPSANSSSHGQFMAFRARITCTESTSWKVTMQIRRRRTGPDKNVAYKQFRGTGSDTFIVGADCEEGQSFNGNFTINILGGSSGGTTARRSIKDKQC